MVCEMNTQITSHQWHRVGPDGHSMVPLVVIVVVVVAVVVAVVGDSLFILVDPVGVSALREVFGVFLRVVVKEGVGALVDAVVAE